MGRGRFYYIANSKGQIIGAGYDPFKTNKEAKEYLIREVKCVKNWIDRILQNK